jgi:hypothetical protein
MATAAAAFKKGATVRFQSRVRKGRGTIKSVKQTGRGIWYGVETTDGDTIFVRVSGLKAA